MAIPNDKPPALLEGLQCFTYTEALPECFDRSTHGEGALPWQISKSPIRIAQKMANQLRSVVSQQFRASGYCFSTIDANEKEGRPYIENPGLDKPA